METVMDVHPEEVLTDKQTASPMRGCFDIMAIPNNWHKAPVISLMIPDPTFAKASADKPAGRRLAVEVGMETVMDVHPEEVLTDRF
jgi:hypothetical protein